MVTTASTSRPEWCPLCTVPSRHTRRFALPGVYLRRFNALFPSARGVSLSVLHITGVGGCGNLNRMSIGFRTRGCPLGPRLTLNPISVDQEPLGLSARGFLGPTLFVTYSYICFSGASSAARASFLRLPECSPTGAGIVRRPTASAAAYAVIIHCGPNSTGELLRTLQ